MIEQASQFLALESQIHDLEVIESCKLKEHQYEIVNTLRCAQQPATACSPAAAIAPAAAALLDRLASMQQNSCGLAAPCGLCARPFL